jgi:PhnB protein
MAVPDEYKKKVLHAIFQFGENTLMASDTLPDPDRKIVVGNNVSLSLDLGSPAEIDSVFGKLANKGRVTMPLQDTFWNARFGMLIDKFGICWMLNHDRKN